MYGRITTTATFTARGSIIINSGGGLEMKTTRFTTSTCFIFKYLNKLSKHTCNILRSYFHYTVGETKGDEGRRRETKGDEGRRRETTAF